MRIEIGGDALHRALRLAALAHGGQKRKGRVEVPYVCHPALVGMELLRLGYDQDTAVAGVLHDILEDGFPDRGRDEVREMVRKEFGDKVLSLIEAITEPKDPRMTREEKRRTWEARKMAQMEKLKAATPEARAIACVDVWTNMLEMKQTFLEEGPGARGYFNVDLGKKFEHWRREIELFKQDRGLPHSSLVQEMEVALRELERLALATGKE